MTSSQTQPHQRGADIAQENSRVGAPRRAGLVVQTVREAFKRLVPITNRQHADEVHHQDRQRLGQSAGRHFGRRLRARRGE